jgi:acetoin utilization protein AcuB
VTKSDLLGRSPPHLNPFSLPARIDPALGHPVRSIMSRQLVTVLAGSPIEEAAQVLVERRLGGVPVLQDGLLAGMLTESDLFRAFTAALGSRERGFRVSFDASAPDDVVAFAVAAAGRHGLRVASVVTYSREGRRTAVVRLVGSEAPGFVDELWRTGHRVLRVVRLGDPPSIR